MVSKPKERVYWDSNIFIAWIRDEKRPGHEMDGLLDCVERVEKGEVIICTSSETALEVLEGMMTDEQRERYQRLLRSRRCQPLPYDVRVQSLAKLIREYYSSKGEKLPSAMDAKHLATAIHYDVGLFYTFDNGGKGGRSLLELDGNVAGFKLKICKPPVGQMRLEYLS
jgi:predicted nucleic acid-binding protein